MIVEPVAGSTGVLIPPKGYLERLREICNKHGILLIFDEVITGFGRLGTPFAADYFGVTPDIIVTAKGLTNGVIPMGAVFVKNGDPRRLHERPRAHDRVLPRLHLFGQSDRLRPPASPRSTPTRRRACSTRGAELADYWEDALHSLEGPAARHRHPQPRPGRRDRAGADRRRSRPSAPSPPSSKAFEKGLLIRTTGDIIAHVAAADHREGADRRADRHAAGHPQDARLNRRASRP